MDKTSVSCAFSKISSRSNIFRSETNYLATTLQDESALFLIRVSSSHKTRCMSSEPACQPIDDLAYAKTFTNCGVWLRRLVKQEVHANYDRTKWNYGQVHVGAARIYPAAQKTSRKTRPSPDAGISEKLTLMSSEPSPDTCPDERA